MAIGLGTIALAGAGAYLVGDYLRKEEQRKKRKKKKAEVEPPVLPDRPGGNYRLAVIQNGQVVGASCASCGFFDARPSADAGPDGFCEFWKKPASSAYVCDEYTPRSVGEMAEILWDDPADCTGWYLPEQWIVRIARPAFYEVLDTAQADGQPLESLDPAIVTHIVLDESMPPHCPIPGAPDGDFRTLQTTRPGQPDYFANEAVLGLYWHVLEGVESTIEQIVQAGEGVLFPM